MSVRRGMKVVGLLVIGGSCGWGLSVLDDMFVAKDRVETLRSGDEPAARIAGVEIVDNRAGIEALAATLADSGGSTPVSATNRIAAAEALAGHEGLREPIRALSRAAIDDPDPAVRLACTKAISDFTHDRIFLALGRVAQSLPAETDAEVLEAKRRLLRMGVFTDTGEAATRQMSAAELSSECLSHLSHW